MKFLRFSFHSPADVAMKIDKKKFHVLCIFKESDFLQIESCVKEIKIGKLLFVNSIALFKKYEESNSRCLKKFRVLVFDTPQNFFKYKYRPDDAKKQDGHWVIEHKILKEELWPSRS